MKKLIPAYILSFIITFILYVIEPISLFVNNRNDFQFNFVSLIRPILLITLVVFIAISLCYTIVYFIDKKVSKKQTVFNITMIISYILFISTYIQGNYLIGNLPVLDGSKPDWSIYLKDNIITIIILLIIIASFVICIKKFGFDKVIKNSNYITLAIFAMIFVGFIPSLLNKELYKNDRIVFVNNNNINNISENKNFLIFVVDAVDSKTFSRELLKSEYKNMMKDFTYYPDTLSMYIFTRDSIPYILSGKANYNEKEFDEYYNEAMDNSPLIDRLIDEKYQINLYETDAHWNTKKSEIVQNVGDFDRSFSSMCFLKQQTKYDLFKYLPFFLKPLSRINHFNINSCKTDYIPDAFSFADRPLYDTVINNPELKKVDNNYFSFIHIEGGHVPFDIDENLERIEEGTYSQKIRATIKVIDSYLERLRKSNEYDNSVIIVMADHGYVDGKEGTRANPILYIKGINEHHDMITSDKAISYADLMDAYNDLLDGKKSTELFPNIGSERFRKYIWYRYLEEDHKVEIATNGKAWEYQKEYKTGKEFNR